MNFATAILYILLAAASSAVAQPLIHTSHTIKGSTYITSTGSLGDGSVIAFGYTNYGNALLEKIAPDGKPQWIKYYTLGKGLNFITGRAMGDGSIIALGISPVGSGEMMVVVKCSADGSIEWTKTSGINILQPRNSCISIDGGIIGVGPLGIFKIDSSGNPAWVQSLSYPKGISFQPRLVCEEKDATIIVGGTLTVSKTGADEQWLCLLKVSNTGTLLKQRVFRTSTRFLTPSSMAVLPNGSILIGGYAQLVSGLYEYPLLARCSDSLTMEWCEIFASQPKEVIEEVLVSSSGEITGLGISQDVSGSGNLIRLFSADTSGTVLRSTITQGIIPSYGNLSRFSTTKGYAALIGTTTAKDDRSFDILTFDPGIVGCNTQSDLPSVEQLETIDSSFSFTQHFFTYSLKLDHVNSFTEKLSDTVLCTTSSAVDEHDNTKVAMVYPNPASQHVGAFIIVPKQLPPGSLVLRDITGREVYRTYHEPTSAGEQIQIPTAGLASGVYTIELGDISSFANVWRGKVVVE